MNVQTVLILCELLCAGLNSHMTTAV